MVSPERHLHIASGMVGHQFIITRLTYNEREKKFVLEHDCEDAAAALDALIELEVIDPTLDKTEVVGT